MGSVAEGDRIAYYRGALAALHFVEQRRATDRRFGANADARWGAFKGDLVTADRIDLLIRDADAQWPAAFGARSVFGLRAVAEDESFGAEWSPLDPVDAEDVWRAALADDTGADVFAAVQGVARAWDIELAQMDVGAIDATERIVVVGPSAIASLIAAFAAGDGLDWAEQVVCVATSPAHRHIAAAGAALAPSPTQPKATRLVAATDEHAGAGYRLVVSDDSAPGDILAGQRIAGS